MVLAVDGDQTAVLQTMLARLALVLDKVVLAKLHHAAARLVVLAVEERPHRAARRPDYRVPAYIPVAAAIMELPATD